MATRKSLTSRGYTSVDAGPSSTNRFLKPPRVVSEYTTVAEELRATKNAVGPAAQPLRPRARVEQQVSEGDPIDTSYVGGRARASVRGSEASLETSKGIRGAVDSFGAIPATISASKSRATSIGIGGTVVDVLTGGLSKPFTTVMSGVAAYDAYKTNKELSDPLYGTPADTVQRSINKALESLKSFNVEEEIIDPIVDTFSNIKNTIGLGSKTAPNINLTPKTKALSKVSKQNPFNINKVRVSTQPLALRTVKEAAQTTTLNQRQQAVDNFNDGTFDYESGSDDGSYDSGVDNDGNATGQDQYD